MRSLSPSEFLELVWSGGGAIAGAVTWVALAALPHTDAATERRRQLIRWAGVVLLLAAGALLAPRARAWSSADRWVVGALRLTTTVAGAALLGALARVLVRRAEGRGMLSAASAAAGALLASGALLQVAGATETAAWLLGHLGAWGATPLIAARLVRWRVGLLSPAAPEAAAPPAGRGQAVRGVARLGLAVLALAVGGVGGTLAVQATWAACGPPALPTLLALPLAAGAFAGGFALAAGVTAALLRRVEKRLGR